MSDDSQATGTGSRDHPPSASPNDYEATGEELRESRERWGTTSPGSNTAGPGGVPAGTEGEEHFPNREPARP